MDNITYNYKAFDTNIVESYENLTLLKKFNLPTSDLQNISIIGMNS